MNRQFEDALSIKGKLKDPPECYWCERCKTFHIDDGLKIGDHLDKWIGDAADEIKNSIDHEILSKLFDTVKTIKEKIKSNEKYKDVDLDKVPIRELFVMGMVSELSKKELNNGQL